MATDEILLALLLQGCTDPRNDVVLPSMTPQHNITLLAQHKEFNKEGEKGGRRRGGCNKLAESAVILSYLLYNPVFLCIKLRNREEMHTYWRKLGLKNSRPKFESSQLCHSTKAQSGQCAKGRATRFDHLDAQESSRVESSRRG